MSRIVLGRCRNILCKCGYLDEMPLRPQDSTMGCKYMGKKQDRRGVYFSMGNIQAVCNLDGPGVSEIKMLANALEDKQQHQQRSYDFWKLIHSGFDFHSAAATVASGMIERD